MPARSKSQQRLFGMVHAYQKGKLKNAPEEVKNIARSISDEDAEHFAKTKHKGLPEKKAYELGFMNKLAEFGIVKKAVSFSRDGSTFQLAAGETPGHAVRAWNSANPGRKVTTRKVLSANPKVKATGYRVGTRYRTGLTTAAPIAKKPAATPAPVMAPVRAPTAKAQAPARPVAQRPEGTPIGYWNNNPGNLVSDGRTEWEGIRQILPKGKNMEFNDYGSGYRAMSRILYNYGAKHGIDTPLATVSRFAKSAPAAKKTEYANFLKSKTGWGPNDKIDLTKEDTLQKLVPSMASFEIGPAWTAKHDPSVVSNAVTRAIPPR